MLNVKISNQPKKDVPTVDSNSVVKNIGNWYSDRYNSIVVQRNLLFILLVAAVIIVASSVFIVGNIASTFKIQPFVVDIEPQTGITNVVNPLANHELTTNEALNKYFLMKYVSAREGYNVNNWEYNFKTVVRLLSTPEMYNIFIRFINTDPNSPIALYGSQMSTYVVFRSIQLFPGTEIKPGVFGDPQAVVRFTVYPSNGGTLNGVTGNRIHKILTANYTYQQTEMSEDDRQVNPLGFFITSYQVDIENTDVPN